MITILIRIITPMSNNKHDFAPFTQSKQGQRMVWCRSGSLVDFLSVYTFVSEPQTSHKL